MARNEARTGRARPHPTLGRSGYQAGDRRAVEWTAESFRGRGVHIWAVYRDQGLGTSMRTVDYGCGSLRVGQHAIKHLDPARYCGIDPSIQFIEAGLSLLDVDVLAAKRPWLDRLDDGVIDRVRQWRPQFIFSHAVLQHVPRSELPIYFGRLGAMMGPGCKAVIMFVCASKERRTKAMSWAYPEALLEGVARAAIAGARISFAALPAGKEGISGGGRRLMIVEKDALGNSEEPESSR